MQLLHHSRVFTSLSAWARTVTKTHATPSTEQCKAQELQMLQSSSTVIVSGLTDCNCFIKAVSSLPSVLGHARSPKTHATPSTEQRKAQKLEVLQSSSTVSVSGLTDCKCFITAVSSLPAVLGHARSKKKTCHPVNRAVQSSEARGVAEFVNRECQRIDRLQLLHHSRVFTSLSAWARTVKKKTCHPVNRAVQSSEARGVAEFVNRECQRIDRLQLLHHSRVFTSLSARACMVTKPMPPRQQSSAKLRS